jgi:hypothetical protein
MQKAMTPGVDGIDSPFGARSARSVLMAIPGARAVEIEAGTITVRFDADRVMPAQFRTALSVMGFQLRTATFASALEPVRLPASEIPERDLEPTPTIR